MTTSPVDPYPIYSELRRHRPAVYMHRVDA